MGRTAAALAGITLGYLGVGPVIYGKKDGLLPPLSRTLIAPTLWGQALSLRHYARSCTLYSELVPGLLIGRKPDDREAAELTGLKAGTAVIAGCMDTIGASLGSGVVRPGGCFLIIGTATRLASPLDQPSFDSRFMNSTHVMPKTWLTLGAMNGVGSSLRWLRDNFGQMEQQTAEQTGHDVYDLLTAHGIHLIDHPAIQVGQTILQNGRVTRFFRKKGNFSEFFHLSPRLLSEVNAKPCCPSPR